MALTKRGEREADDGAEGGPHVPAVLEGGHRVHGDPEHGDQQLAADQVHQQQVELSPKLAIFFRLIFFHLGTFKTLFSGLIRENQL